MMGCFGCGGGMMPSDDAVGPDVRHMSESELLCAIDTIECETAYRLNTLHLSEVDDKLVDDMHIIARELVRSHGYTISTLCMAMEQRSIQHVWLYAIEPSPDAELSVRDPRNNQERPYALAIYFGTRADFVTYCERLYGDGAATELEMQKRLANAGFWVL